MTSQVFVFFLFFMSGLPSWLLINGIYSQIPTFIASAPEGPSVTAMINITIQFGNLFTFCFVGLGMHQRIKNETIMLVLYSAAGVSSVLLSFLWACSLLGISVFLLLICFIGGLIGSMSVVTFYPFAMEYNSKFVSALSAGSGFSSLVASLLSIIQSYRGVDHKLFSVSWFFVIIAGFCFSSLLCFIYMRLTGVAKRFQYEQTEYVSVVSVNEKSDFEEQKEEITLKEAFGLASYAARNQFIINVMNYTMTGILPFCWAHFSQSDQQNYTLYANVLGMTGGSLSRFSSAWLRSYSLNVQTCIQVVLFGILLFAAVANGLLPASPLIGWLLVFTNAIYSITFQYEDTMAYLWVNNYLEPNQKQQASRCVGTSNQLGAFLGAVISIGITFATHA